MALTGLDTGLGFSDQVVQTPVNNALKALMHRHHINVSCKVTFVLIKEAISMAHSVQYGPSRYTVSWGCNKGLLMYEEQDEE